jgi:hypothetical protein
MELLYDVGHMESHFGPLGGGVVSVQDRCTVCAKCTIGSEIVLDGPDVHLGDVAQLEARFGPFRGSANLDARSLEGLRRMNHMVRNCLGCT